ncbi:MAG TPA: thioesterase [Pusillimonas sp.]|nr:thioesterase [Pusillimonas sp.]|tara:strand:+ start:19778 stop:20236 length:459 start_codon:yes stop_codon:yes gene_type:complete
MISTEHVVCELPFTVRRTVKWGQCDPAGVVYTVVFAEYVISTAELFYGSLFGQGPQQAKDEYQFGTPTRGLTFDFRKSLRPDDLFDTEVRVGRIGTSTYQLLMHARDMEGDTVFTACLTPICIVRGQRESISIPEHFKEKLKVHQSSDAPES